MAEPSKTEFPEPKDSGIPRLKRKLYENRWWIVFVLAGFPLFVLPDWGRGQNFGNAAWACSISIAVALNAFWSAKAKWWFRITAAAIVTLHVVALFSIHWTDAHHFGAEYRGYMEIDFIAIYAILWVAREIARLLSPTDSRAEGPTI